MGQDRVGSGVKIDFSVVQGVLGEEGSGVPLAIVKVSDDIKALGSISLELTVGPSDPDPNQGVIPYKGVGASDYARELLGEHYDR